MKLIMYTADCVGNGKNTYYPYRAEVTDADSFRAAIAHDHVCAEYKDNYRGNANFIEASCLVLDIDNDHTDLPEEFITIDALLQEFAGVDCAIAHSRNSGKVKGDKSARPRLHIYFRCGPYIDPDSYASVKRFICSCYPFFDSNALDAGRLIFGAASPEVVWNEGGKSIEEFLAGEETDTSIPEGKRNATMSRFAGKIVKRYGPTEEAHNIFLQQAQKCYPPLDDAELATIWASACRFAKKIQNQQGYIPPEQYAVKASLKPADFSDIGQATMIALDCANELAFTTGTDFLRYNGQYWVESKVKATGLVQEFTGRQLEDAKAEIERAKQALIGSGVSEKDVSAGGKALEKQINDSQLQAYFDFMNALAYKAFVMKRRDTKYVQSALAAVKPMVEVETRDLDKEPNLLNCPDGTYDLAQGLAGRRDHDPADFITKMTAYAPGDEGMDLWQDALNKTFQGDQELIEYVQQTVGLGAIGEVYQEALIIAYGDGSNGKSTFWNTIAGALGNYSGMISADALMANCKRNVKPELAEIKGKRLVIAAETEEGVRLSTSIVKQLCSTDEIEGERKYKDPFKFRPTHLAVLYTNHLPKVGAMDYGIWRRLIVIPFNAKIQGRGDVLNYSKHLLDHAGPAVVKWIIEGAEKALKNKCKLKLPACVWEAIEQYRADNDWMAHFLSECCVEEDDAEARSGELYASYRAFCARTGEFARSTTEFYATLEKRGFDRHKRKKGVFVTGLRLADTESDF